MEFVEHCFSAKCVFLLAQVITSRSGRNDPRVPSISYDFSVRVQSSVKVDPHLVIPELLKKTSHVFLKRANIFLHMHNFVCFVWDRASEMSL